MYNYNQNPYNTQYQGDRFVGGGAFLGPFLLGGITGGLAAPLFYNGYNRPNNNYYYPVPYPYPVYQRPPYRPYNQYYR